MRRLPLVTNSELTTYRRCPKEWMVSYDQGYRTVDKPDALRLGTSVHDSLERRLRHGVWHPRREDYADDYEYERYVALLDGYGLRWSSDFDEYEILAVEAQFDAPLVNPETGAPSSAYRLGGKLDAVVREIRSGDVYVLEHKTSSQDVAPGSTYWSRLRLDSQISTYMVGARALGFEPRGVIYDVLRKPGEKPSEIPLLDDDGLKVVLDASGARVSTKDGKKYRETGDAKLGYVLQTRKETPAEYGQRVRVAIAAEPDAYYQRGVIVRLADEEREAAADTWQFVARIRESRRTGVAPRNPDACVRYNRPCSYFPVCSGETTLDNPLRYRRTETAHEELAAQ